MKKLFVLTFFLFFFVQLNGLTAQSVDTSSQAQTTETPPKKEKKGFFSWLFNWGSSKNSNSATNKDKNASLKVEIDYSKMEMEELEYQFITNSISGNLDVLIKLLKYGVNINCTNSHGRTALIEVARNGTIKTAQWLIDRGASINYKDMYDGNALVYATQSGKSSMVTLLIQNGARKEISQ